MASRRAGAARTGRGSRKKKPATPKWTKTREDIFFAELSEVCNVAAAARAAGFPDGESAYHRKDRDPEFRVRYYAAIDESYDRLELEMLERGRFGEDRPADAGESSSRLRAIPTGLALSLLKLHAQRRRGREEAAPPKRRPLRGKALRDRLEAELSAINRRLGGNG